MFHQPQADDDKGWFKVMSGPPYRAISLAAVERHRARIEHNHGQSLERLNQRGGLDWYELWCAFNDRSLFPLARISEDAQRRFVLDYVKQVMLDGAAAPG